MPQDAKRLHREAAILFLTSIEVVDARRRQNSAAAAPGLLPPSLSPATPPLSPRTQRKPVTLRAAQPAAEACVLRGLHATESRRPALWVWPMPERTVVP